MDEVRAEYEFSAMKVVQQRPDRGSRGKAILLAEHVAEVFPASEAVNEALRTPIRSGQALKESGAGDEIRTRNLNLGKVLPYHWATPA